MDSEDLTYIEVTEEEQEEIDSVLIVNSNYPELSAQLNEYVPIFDNITKIWIGKDDGLKYFNKTIENPQKNLTVLVHFNQVPFSFIRDGELVGILPHVVYGFANKYNYSLEIVEAQNNDQYIQDIKDNKVNISIGYLFKGSYKNDDSLLIIKSTNERSIFCDFILARIISLEELSRFIVRSNRTDSGASTRIT